MVQMLKPRLATASTQRGKFLDITPGATPRQRGYTYMKRRGEWMRDHPLCRICEAAGIARIADELDHIQPLALGGADDRSNWQSLCIEHHRAKSAAEAAITRRGW